jgi:hypothetical protein
MLTTNYTLGLVNYWPVLPGASTVLNLITKNSLTSASPLFTTDRFGNANSAFAVRDTVSFWSLPSAVYFTGDFTITAWIRVNAFTTWARLFDCGNGASSDNVLIMLTTANSNELAINIFSNSVSIGNQITTYTSPLNVWFHLAVSLTGSSVRMYANGVSILSNGQVYPPQNVTRNSCYFGNSNWDTDPPCIADFDEIKFFNRGLSQAEVAYDFSSINSFMIQL